MANSLRTMMMMMFDQDGTNLLVLFCICFFASVENMLLSFYVMSLPIQQNLAMQWTKQNFQNEEQYLPLLTGQIS